MRDHPQSLSAETALGAIAASFRRCAARLVAQPGRRDSAVLPRAAAVFTTAAAVLVCAAASADEIAVINALRTGACGAAQAGTRVLPDVALNEVARAFADTGALEAALERVAYPAAGASSYHVRGSREDAVMARLLAQKHCESINDERFDVIGVHARGDETWIVLAVHQPEAPELEPVAVAIRVVALVNAARAEARACGRERFEAAPPLVLAPALTAAATAHATDMAARGVPSHRGSDGSEPGERIARAGYTWQASGENVAAGQPDADAVVAAWLSSPGHCATLMAPYFTETGIAYALVPEKNPAIYWTQVFAAPLSPPPD